MRPFGGERGGDRGGDRADVAGGARDPYKGITDAPGGFLEPGEHPVEALKREVMEELGVEVEAEWPPEMFAPHRYGDDGVNAPAIGSRATLLSGAPSPSDDVANIPHVTPDDADSPDFAWEHDRGLMRDPLR